MTLEQLTLMPQARPFQPFDIFLVDGRSLPVEHPEFLSRSPTGRTIGGGGGGRGTGGAGGRSGGNTRGFAPGPRRPGRGGGATTRENLGPSFASWSPGLPRRCAPRL